MTLLTKVLVPLLEGIRGLRTRTVLLTTSTAAEPFSSYNRHNGSYGKVVLQFANMFLRMRNTHTYELDKNITVVCVLNAFLAEIFHDQNRLFFKWADDMRFIFYVYTTISFRRVFIVQ